MTDYKDFVSALASPQNQPQTACDALYELARDLVGVKLFTLLSYDFEAGVSARFYSNMPGAYPVSGTKPINKTYWSGIVIDQKKTFVANSIDKIAEVFFDHELIQSLGCESVINVPVVIGGNVIGSINCLHEANYYTEDRVRAAEALKLPAAACFLLRERMEKEAA